MARQEQTRRSEIENVLHIQSLQNSLDFRFPSGIVYDYLRCWDEGFVRKRLSMCLLELGWMLEGVVGPEGCKALFRNLLRECSKVLDLDSWVYFVAKRASCPVERCEEDGSIIWAVFKGMNDSRLGGPVLSSSSKQRRWAQCPELTFNSVLFEIARAIGWKTKTHAGCWGVQILMLTAVGGGLLYPGQSYESIR